MRYLVTEQFLGMIFSSLIENNIFEISFSDLNILEKQADQVLRKKNKTILMVCSNAGIFGIEEYNDFFDVEEHKIMLQQKLREKENKEHVLEKITDYFTIGIPKDIQETLKEAVNTYTMRSTNVG